MSAWLLAIMLAALPPARQAPEPEDAARARYEAIAGDLAHIVGEAEPLFAGPLGRHRGAALLLAITYHESAWRLEVDRGEKRGDRGRSWCLAQIHVGRGRTAEGWTGPELVGDRRKCFAAALALVRRSMAACRGVGVDGMLRAYASGSCQRGARESTTRVRTAQRWFAAHRPEASP